MPKRYDVSNVVEISPRKKRSGAKGCLTAFIVFLCLVLVATGGLFYYIKSLGINEVKTQSREHKNAYDLLSDEDGDLYEGTITAMQYDQSLKGILRGWYDSEGDIMATRNIMNILIIGIDASGDEELTGNSDTMMIASVNRKAKTITLCSFLRDSYTYFMDTKGNGYYSRLNAAYAYGGADCLINAIENNYKIRIDYFAAVDFDGFEGVIDAIGGITMTVTEEEAKAIEDYAHITGVPYGEDVTLNGEQALLFSRMRKIYVSGDIQRTRNQRRVINAIINKAKQNLSLSSLNKIISTLAPYVYTDCSTTNLITLGANAVLGRWYDFDVYSMEAPPESCRHDAIIDNGTAWVFIVDYPKSAQYVQSQLYGKTNIIIPSDAVSAIDSYVAYGE